MIRTSKFPLFARIATPPLLLAGGARCQTATATVPSAPIQMDHVSFINFGKGAPVISSPA